MNLCYGRNRQYDGIKVLMMDFTVIVMPTGMEYIDSQAFEGCTALEEIVLPYGLKKIEYWAFHECSNLKKVTIPRTTYAIDANAFEHPEQLTIYGLADTYAETYANNVEAAFVDISVHAAGVKLNMEKLDMFVGDTKVLEANVTPVDCTDLPNWVSSNNYVAMVSEYGEITAYNEGTATITVEVGDVSASCTVTVTRAVTFLRFELDDISLAVGEKKGTYVYILPNNATK